MIIDQAMAAEEPQPGMPLALATGDALVRKALLPHAAVDRRAALDRAGGVARHGSESRRKLERHFREALGMTPLQAFR